MTSGKAIKIIGLGKYLPQKVSSEELEKKYDIPSTWSERHSGVRNRHHVTFESNGYMGARAIEKALEQNDMKLTDIDLIISAGATFDYSLPNQACVIKSELNGGLKINIPVFDIDSSCLSFVSAFEVAASLLDGKKYSNIIIVSSEIASKGLDSRNWETATLFGDGAVALILRFDPNSESAFIKSDFKTYSEGVNDSIIKGGGNNFFFRDYPYDQKLHSFQMNGKKLLRLAKNKLPEFIDDFFKDLNLSIEETDVIVPHQASKLGLSILSQMYNLKENQVKQNLLTHGNCIAASIPLLFCDEVENGSIKRGDTCFLIGTAAGFSIGAILLKY